MVGLYLHLLLNMPGVMAHTKRSVIHLVLHTCMSEPRPQSGRPGDEGMDVSHKCMEIV